MSELTKQVTERRIRWKKNIIKTMGNECQCCGYNKYYGALELHHLNPTEKDFSFSDKTYRAWADIEQELKKCVLLCANCHREVEAHLINIDKSSFNQQIYDEIKEEIKNKKSKKIYTCPICGAEIWNGSKLCRSCSNKAKRTIERPDRNQLKNLIRTTSFVQIGRQFNVSDNTIRKWCKAEGLPEKALQIKKYTDEEWRNI